jgi:hypothetical protein
METIAILLYTDFPWIAANPDAIWSVDRLLSFTVLKTKGIANVSFKVLLRDSTNLKRLDATLLKDYQQLWLFGFIDRLDEPFGLSPEELQDVSEWMNKGGGVLVTGDHSISRRTNECHTDHRDFKAHGRALGSKILRAGQLRDWEGPPTACDNLDLPLRDNFNTQEGDDPNALDEMLLQSDGLPQTLLDEPVMHPLFFWHVRDGRRIPITRFPDHQHEGKLVRLEKLDDEWPEGSPKPVVAARGRDKRFPKKPRVYDLVIAYDGFPADVGRIVADSSFHHYLKPNLVGLNGTDCCGNPIPDSDLDQIAQYYGNLALWLTPKSVQRDIKLGLLSRAALHPDVLEIWGTSKGQLSDTANQSLQREVGVSNLSRLFSPSFDREKVDTLDAFLGWIFLGENSDKFAQADRRIILGSIVEAFHIFLESEADYIPPWLKELREPEYFVVKGLELAKAETSGVDKILALVQPALT